MFAFVIALLAVSIVVVGFLSWFFVTINMYRKMRHYRAMAQIAQIPVPVKPKDGWTITYKERGKTKTYQATGATEGAALKDFMLNSKAQYNSIVSAERN